MTRLRLALAATLFPSLLFAGFASTESYLAAVGRVPGANGAQFYTTIWLTNLTTAPQTFTFEFLKGGQANPSPASFHDTLQPGETKVYENVVETKLGLSNALGAARITSSGEIFVAERIYNQQPGDDLGNTEGLFFAGVPKTFSISSGQSASIQGIDQGGAENFRYNFALIETGGGSPTVNIEVFDGSGTLLGQKSYPLSPYEQIQPNVADVVPGIHTTNARITATVDGSGSIILAGAQLANESQDSSGFEMTFPDSLLGTGGGTAGVIHDSTLTGEGTSGSPLSVNPASVVTSLNGLHGSLTLAAGSNVTITPNGATLTIASSGGGGELALPFSGSSNASQTTFAVSNTAGGQAIEGDSIAAKGFAIKGLATGAMGTGVYGTDGPTGETDHAAVWGDSHSSMAVLGTSFLDRGVLGSTSNPSAAGVEGFNRAASGVGVLGHPASVSGAGGLSGGVGVWGDSDDVGVYGSGNNVSVYGACNPAFNCVGVGGTALANHNLAGYFDGGISVTNGSKSFVEPHPTDPTKEIRYVSLEGRESGTYFRGTGHIVDGFATIEVPEDFRMVSRPDGLTVQLTPVGDMAVLAAASRSLDRIVVRGSKDVEFDYMVNGVRATVPKLVPIEENRLFVPQTPDDRSLTRPLDPVVRTRLVRSGILNEDGTINLETAHRLGWDKSESWKRAKEEGAKR